MACAQFNKGQCTFLEQPLKRSKRNSVLDKERVTKPRKNSKQELELEVSHDLELTFPVVQNSPVLAFPSDLNTELMRGNAAHMSKLGFPQMGVLLWQQVMDQARSHSTGNIHTPPNGASQLHTRSMLYAQQPESVLAQVVDGQPLHQELVDDYKFYPMQQQQQQMSIQQPPMSQIRQTSLPQPRELEQLENHLVSQHQNNSPYYFYGASEEPQPLLDNSEFISLATGSILSSRLSTSVWLPQALDTGPSAIDGTELVDAANELDFLIGTRFPPAQQTQHFQLGLQPLYYCQDTYSNFNNGGFFGGPTAVVSTQNNAYPPNHMK